VALLVGIAFVAGMVTAISPCVLPVLPIVFAAGTTGDARRPYTIVAGLVCSFTAFTLIATVLLSALGLPNDLLRNIAIGVVIVLGLSLLVPRLGVIIERPFQAAGRFRPGSVGGGFLLGICLGLLFTPCAGPIIAAVATVAATEQFTVSAVLVTLAYALGAGTVLLGLAFAVRRGLDLAPLRAHGPGIRRALGGLVLAVGILMAFGLNTRLQTKVPGYTHALQGLEESAAASTRIEGIVGGPEPLAQETADLEDFGQAPDFAGITDWLNSAPLTLADLRGKVVLLDFWTYSCVNCLRTLPFLKSWYATYRDQGFVVVGVHTPEFAFERDVGNVRNAVDDLGIDYPVALDSNYGTWNAWGNRYWPAEYFIDRQGHVRFFHAGEGAYEEKEQIIRSLLAEPDLPASVSSSIRDDTPTMQQTPETYLGYLRLERFLSSPVAPDEEHTYALPKSPLEDWFGLGGRWKIEGERAVAGQSAVLDFRYRAGKVFLVLGTGGSKGTVHVALNGEPIGKVSVDEHKLYQLATTPGDRVDDYNDLELRFSPGVEAYAFTFGS
jgi:cytochrome c biogenesis protein CcdA/thiol-disulfide isomerase/thioredoxin